MVLHKVDGDTERLMREGQAAAKRGDKVMARALLTQLLERDPHNEQAWMWLSGVVGDPQEQQTCLENVLIINPNNPQARKGLEYISAKTGVTPRSTGTLVESAPPSAPVYEPPTQWPDTPAAAATSVAPTFAPSMAPPTAPTLALPVEATLPPPDVPAPFNPFASVTPAAAPSDEFTQLLADVAGAIETHVEGGAPEAAQPVAEGFALSDLVTPGAEAAAPAFTDFSLPNLGASELPPWAQAEAEAAHAAQNGSADPLVSGHENSNGHPVPATATPELPDFAALLGSATAIAEGAHEPAAAVAGVPVVGEEPFVPVEGVLPFQPPADDAQSVYTGGPATVGGPPDLSSAIPDWVREGGAPPQPEAPVEVASGPVSAPTGAVADTNAPATEAHSYEVPVPAAQESGLEADLSAWLGQVARDASAQPEQPIAQVESAPAPPFNDPFTGGSQPAFGMDPFMSNQLPSPEELPGGHSESTAGSQPWYLQPSNEQVASPPEYNYGPGDPYGMNDDGPVAAPAKPATYMACPNCHKQVPDTMLACPECNYSFFVHCPHCHELVDTTDARPGVVEPCPYCGSHINKIEMGLINIQGISTAAPEIVGAQMTQWTGEAPPETRRRMSPASLLADFMVLVVIVLMVWALTQLPTWFNLTNLYN